MQKLNKYNSIFPYIFSISMILFIVMASFYFACFFDKNLLVNLFDKYDTPKNLPFILSRDDLILIQNELMDYLAGKIPFLETKVHINGILTDFYSIRTKIHMGDVRNLFKILVYACYISIAVCIFSFFKVKNTCDDSLVRIKNAFKKVLIVFAVIFIVLILCASINFDSFFIKFHELLFDNDYWLLDPREDYIICLMPENFFMDIGIRIAIISTIFLLVFYCCLMLLSKIQLRQEAK